MRKKKEEEKREINSVCMNIVLFHKEEEFSRLTF